MKDHAEGLREIKDSLDRVAPRPRVALRRKDVKHISIACYGESERPVLKLRDKTILPSCEICTHGYDTGTDKGSDVFCAPKRKTVSFDHVCSGFRLITRSELDERTTAWLGVETFHETERTKGTA